jgi:hypothetical protein
MVRPLRSATTSAPTARWNLRMRGSCGCLSRLARSPRQSDVSMMWWRCWSKTLTRASCPTLTGTPKSMMTSVADAIAGNKFWFATGPAAVRPIHMVTGAMYGIAFAVIAPRIPRSFLVPAGAAFGLVLGALAVRSVPAAASTGDDGKVRSVMLSRCVTTRRTRSATRLVRLVGVYDADSNVRGELALICARLGRRVSGRCR